MLLIFVDIIIILIWLLVMSIIVTGTVHLFLRVPYVPTKKKVVEEMIDFADLKGNEVIYDLGAGDGRILISAKKRYPNCTAKGVELSPTVYLWAKIRIWWSGQDVDLRMKNLHSIDLSDADCIFVYLMPGTMKRLEKKLDEELKPGTKIVSNAFRFSEKTEEKHKEVEWIQGKRQIRLYRW